MKHQVHFWKLEALSDRQLLERVGSILGSSRRLMAELIAHLGEVEERRLHLAAACSSMFAYCLKLGMTEDEAYRRIEVARLARLYPAIFPLLAVGQLTISVVALLKHHLSSDNHVELLAAVTGKSVVQTRELIAERFPRPDVPTSVRKLPERRTLIPPSLTLSRLGAPRTGGTESCVAETESRSGGTESRGSEPRTSGMEPRAAETEPCTGGTEPCRTELRVAETESHTSATQPSHSDRAAPPRVSSHIEPLSAQRYKVQFTASADVVRKLELATDLMRHCHPGGELGPVVERALDLLIESLMQRRFGTSKKTSPKPPRERANLEQRGDPTGKRFAIRHTAEPATAEPATAEPEPTTDTPATAEPGPASPTRADARAKPNPPTTLETPRIERKPHAEGERPSTPYIPRCTRQTVVERDGLGCSWVDEQGVRCGSRAWLEYDHRHPRAKGGSSEPGNVRLLCRQHNRFAAERAYGRRHVEKHIAERRRARAQDAPHAI